MTTIIIIVVGLAIAIWYWTNYNALVNAFLAVNQSWSNIEVELKRRLDLIANLVEATKGYASYERATFEKVAAVRQAANVSSAALANETNTALTQSVQGLLALAEAYPDLKSNQNFLQLQTELANTENRIAERRNAYNQCVSGYKNLCQQFPTSALASAHSFEAKSFFDAPDEVHNSVKVTFP